MEKVKTPELEESISDVAKQKISQQILTLYQQADSVWENPELEHWEDLMQKFKALAVVDKCLALALKKKRGGQFFLAGSFLKSFASA